MSSTRLFWLSCVITDARVGPVTCRVAAGLATLADDHGRVRSRMAMLSNACSVPTRRMVDHLQKLIELGYLQQQDMSRQGRFAVSLVPQGDDAALASDKPFREVLGSVIAVRAAAGDVAIYVENANSMTKVITDRASASRIAAHAMG